MPRKGRLFPLLCLCISLSISGPDGPLSGRGDGSERAGYARKLLAATIPNGGAQLATPAVSSMGLGSSESASSFPPCVDGCLGSAPPASCAAMDEMLSSGCAKGCSAADASIVRALMGGSLGCPGAGGPCTVDQLMQLGTSADPTAALMALMGSAPDCAQCLLGCVGGSSESCAASCVASKLKSGSTVTLAAIGDSWAFEGLGKLESLVAAESCCSGATVRPGRCSLPNSTCFAPSYPFVCA